MAAGKRSWGKKSTFSRDTWGLQASEGKPFANCSRIILLEPSKSLPHKNTQTWWCSTWDFPGRHVPYQHLLVMSLQGYRTPACWCNIAIFQLTDHIQGTSGLQIGWRNGWRGYSMYNEMRYHSIIHLQIYIYLRYRWYQLYVAWNETDCIPPICLEKTPFYSPGKDVPNPWALYVAFSFGVTRKVRSQHVHWRPTKRYVM